LLFLLPSGKSYAEPPAPEQALFDGVALNEDNHLALDLPEIAIKRRLYRSGESEYFINNASVRLKEVRELFYDTGVGKSAYSVMEQGRIDQILSTKPEERRYLRKHPRPRKHPG